MRILLTNDDGIHAPGLAALERIAAALSDDVWVVAPELDQSGLSHSLSLNDPLRLREVGRQKFALRGTPSDCVIMAVRRILPEGRADLVLSGVNSGQNAADDVTYSGTVAGAIEGTLLGIPSIALSQAYPHGERARIPWETAEAHAPAIIRKLVAFGFPNAVLYNINFPDRPADRVGPVRITAQGKVAHSLFIDERFDGRGNQYFWLAYRRQKEEFAEGTDVRAILDGDISVTALRLDLTAHELAEPLRHHFGRGT
ncbi:MAG TPA: 5'/3'-nucleotidase SurE [Bauldia sp.]|nr:5'/3'-nucleotidase SurE [Bauldia sp.]